MNAADQVHSLTFVHAIASVVTLVRQHFPAAKANLNPWRDDPETRQWIEKESIDLAFHFPGWSPRLQCRSLLFQLTLSSEKDDTAPYLLGVIIRGITYEGERWRLTTLGDWQPTGTFLPHSVQTDQLKDICRDIFRLFPYVVSSR